MALEEKCKHKQSWCHQLVPVKYYTEYDTNWSFYGKYYGANDSGYQKSEGLLKKIELC